jgi:hypothetical protein
MKAERELGRTNEEDRRIILMDLSEMHAKESFF